MSNSLRLTIGMIVSFFTGLGILGFSTVDANFLTANIDSIIGGVLAAISLVGYIEHHNQKTNQTSVTVNSTPTTQATA